MYNDRLYKQIDGVTIESPLGSTSSNFFWGHIKSSFFNNSTVYKPKLYLRYMENIFAAFDREQICKRFLSVLNSKYQNLKFMVEKAMQSLCFLDVAIKIFESSVETLVWCKQPHTRLLLIFNAICLIPGKQV